VKKIDIRLIFVLFILFLLDLIKPLGYFLSVEFLFLGIIFVSLNYRLWQALILCVIAGYIKDSFIFLPKPLSLIEFPSICLVIYYLLKLKNFNIFYFLSEEDFHFARRKAHVFVIKSIIVPVAIIIHIVFNAVCMKVVLPFFFLQFLGQSFFIYFFIDYLLERWIKTQV